MKKVQEVDVVMVWTGLRGAGFSSHSWGKCEHVWKVSIALIDRSVLDGETAMMPEF